MANLDTGIIECKGFPLLRIWFHFISHSKWCSSWRSDANKIWTAQDKSVDCL